MAEITNFSHSISPTTGTSPSKSFMQGFRRALRTPAKGGPTGIVSLLGTPRDCSHFTAVATTPEHEVSPKAHSFNLLKRLEHSLRRSPKNPPINLQPPSLSTTPVSPVSSPQTDRTHLHLPTNLTTDILATLSPPTITSSPPPVNQPVTVSPPQLGGPATDTPSSDNPKVLVGVNAIPISLDRQGPSPDDIQIHQASLEFQNWAQSSTGHNGSFVMLQRSSPQTPPRDLSPSPNSSSASLVEVISQRHQELLRAATSLLCQELGHGSVQFRRNGYTDQECEELERHMRHLVRLERTWISLHGFESDVLAVQELDRRAFAQALRDGYLLCQLMNRLCPRWGVYPDPRDDGFVRTSNVTQFLAACTLNGVPAEDLFQRGDLIEASEESLARVARTMLSLFQITGMVTTKSPQAIGGENLDTQGRHFRTALRATRSTPNLTIKSSAALLLQQEDSELGLHETRLGLLDIFPARIRESKPTLDFRYKGPSPPSPIVVRSSSLNAGLLLNNVPHPRASLSVLLETPRERLALSERPLAQRNDSSSLHELHNDVSEGSGRTTSSLATSSQSIQDGHVEPALRQMDSFTYHVRQSAEDDGITSKSPGTQVNLNISGPSRSTQASHVGTQRLRTPGLLPRPSGTHATHVRPRSDGARTPRSRPQLETPRFSPKSRRSGQRRGPFARSLPEERIRELPLARHPSTQSDVGSSLMPFPSGSHDKLPSSSTATSARKALKPRPTSLSVQGSEFGTMPIEPTVKLDVEKSESSYVKQADIRETLMVKDEKQPGVEYQLGNCIGRGHFASVYRGLNLTTGQMVAVKRIRLEGLTENEIQQLMREVELVKSLSHPNIVRYEGMARDESTLSIVLEYAENGSLGQTLQAFGKLNERLVASYVVKILDGLQYLHHSRVVHCDLKAANILTTKTGNVKLSDFGVSLNLRNLRSMEDEYRDVAGTPNWMAPEVIELQGPSFASDIWSLGCTIIELLTGRPPYAHIPNSMAVMFRVVEDDLPPIPEGCSELLANFLGQCFIKDPTKRPSAKKLGEHEWLKKTWPARRDIRQQDSITSLRRIITELHTGPERSPPILPQETTPRLGRTPLLEQNQILPEHLLNASPSTREKINIVTPAACDIDLSFLEGYDGLLPPASKHELRGSEDNSSDSSELATIRPSSRNLDVQEIIKQLRGVERAEQRARFLNLRGEVAVVMLETLQSWLDDNPFHHDRRRIIKWLIQLASSSNQLPRSLFLLGVKLHSSHNTTWGGYAEVFQGTYNNETVALKRLRMDGNDPSRDQIHKKFCREGLTWRQLKHPNVLPFLGVDRDTFHESGMLGMISPWMERGTLMQYLSSGDYDAKTHRPHLIYEVAEGLEYIHLQGLVHGDLHGSNIFVSAEGRPCLADFGLTIISDITVSHSVTKGTAAGAIRWLAPEMIRPSPEMPTVRTSEADVFSFGRVCLSICTQKHPFHNIPNDIAVIVQVMTGKNPLRPSDIECNGLPISDNLWTIVVQCWEALPEERPNMGRIVTALGKQSVGLRDDSRAQ